jgi:amino-acid N-acetyltransferase
MHELILRTATPADAPAIHALVEAHQTSAHLLPRTLPEIHRRAGSFVVADVDGRVVGCAELASLSRAVAEVRSLVVSPEWRGLGVAADLIEELRQRASTAGFETLTAFTHDATFFVRQNFSIVPHLWVPEKVGTDCVRCPLFRRCGQVAMMSPLRETVRPAVAEIHRHVAVA